jgi:hypothetical protein
VPSEPAGETVAEAILGHDAAENVLEEEVPLQTLRNLDMTAEVAEQTMAESGTPAADEAAEPVEGPTPADANVVVDQAAEIGAEEDAETTSWSGESETETPAPETDKEEPSAILSQQMLDDLLGSLQADDEEPENDAEPENAYTKAQQDVATLLSENTAMEKQITELQAQSRSFTHLSPEERQDIPVPEVIMQEMDTGRNTTPC